MADKNPYGQSGLSNYTPPNFGQGLGPSSFQKPSFTPPGITGFVPPKLAKGPSFVPPGQSKPRPPFQVPGSVPSAAPPKTKKVEHSEIGQLAKQFDSLLKVSRESKSSIDEITGQLKVLNGILGDMVNYNKSATEY